MRSTVLERRALVNSVCSDTLTGDGIWASIIIVAYQSSRYLQNCIDGLKRQTMGSFEVIIVDNACPQDSTDRIILPDHRFRIVKSDTNRGFAGGINFGSGDATGDWIVALNPDTVPERDWLKYLKIASQRHPSFVVLGSTILTMETEKRIDSFGDVFSIYGISWQGGHGRPKSDLPGCDKLVFGASGAAACYRRDHFEAFGGYDEAFFCYLEDVDLSFRLVNSGYLCLQVRKAVVTHFGSASSVDRPDFPAYQTNRNAFRLILKNAPLLMLVPMALSHLLAQSYLLCRNAFSDGSSARLKGFLHGFLTIGPALLARKKARRFATKSSWVVARSLAFKPRSLRLHDFNMSDPDR